MAYVNRMVRWRLTAPDCSPLMESLWCVPACFLSSLLNDLIFPRIKKKKMPQSQPAELSANSPSFSFTFNPALTLWWTRDQGVRARGCGSAALSRPDVPACLLYFWEFFRCKGEIQVHTSLFWTHTNTCKYARTYRDREDKKKKKREQDCVRTRSENSQPTPEATNFCRSAIAARRQLLLM